MSQDKVHDAMQNIGGVSIKCGGEYADSSGK